MRSWVIAAIVGVMSATFAFDAEAQRRLGGGRNIGKQSAPVQRQAQPPAQQQQQAAPAQQAVPAQGAAAARPSMVKGALLGLAAGLGLAALASWLGFSETLAAIMMAVLIGLVIMVVIGFVLRRMRGGPQAGPRPAYQGAAGSPSSHVPQRIEPQPMQRTTALQPGAARPGSAMDEFLGGGAGAAPAGQPAQPWGIPANFDQAGFLLQAKNHYVRMQGAWNQGDLDALSEFTTQQMFTALTHELRARTTAPAATRVDRLDAALLGIETAGNEYIASVRFTGSLDIDGEKEQVDEVWNLAKPIDGASGWLLAGIQQLT